MKAVALFSLREALRRRVFIVVAILTVGCGILYGLAVWRVFSTLESFVGDRPAGIDPEVLAGATLLGLALFGTLFLGSVLAVFLTLGAVRGDAERGLLQPILVRPLTRRQYLLARLLGAGTVCAAYVLAVYTGAAVLIGSIGGWWPERFVVIGLEMAAAVVVVATISLAGSVVLSATANGIAVFMAFGAGLVAGLLGQIAEALGSGTLEDAALAVSWALPFEALYQTALADITAGTGDFTKLAIQLGPLGGAQPAGPLLWAWVIAYVAAVTAVAVAAFKRQDL
jgi:ABC-type transport system involved in multi-copper enzyme maturation permease subunit